MQDVALWLGQGRRVVVELDVEGQCREEAVVVVSWLRIGKRWRVEVVVVVVGPTRRLRKAVQ